MTRILIITVVAIFLIAAMPVISLLVTGDFTGSTHFYGLQEDSDLVDRVLTVREFFTK